MNKKILLIEDEKALQDVLKEILEQEKYLVIQAFNGVDGIKLAKENIPDLILLDLILPKKDGFEVLKTLKNDKKTNQIPVVVLTNLEDVHDIERAFGAGADSYLIKASYKPEEILQKINEVFKNNK